MTSSTSMGREDKPVETSKARCRFPPQRQVIDQWQKMSNFLMTSLIKRILNNPEATQRWRQVEGVSHQSHYETRRNWTEHDARVPGSMGI
jgi:hypothetical protein